MRRYGWFEYGQEPRKITNYLTGQELVIKSVTEVPNMTIYDCSYKDSEIVQLVRFSIHQDMRKDIKLDYRDTIPGCPPYGYWRRIDDFLVDALLCWPDFLDRGGFSLHTIGGWRSGAWNPELRRQFSSRKSGTPDQLTNYLIAEPYLIPLETTSPPPWRLVDVESPATEANLKFELLTDSNVPYLSRSSPVEGFQGLVPFLEREDKAAYIIFSKLQPSSHRGEDPEVLLYYTYVDQDIFFRFRSHPFYKLELGTCIDYGFREFPHSRELWTTKPLGELVPGNQTRPKENVLSQFSYLSYPVWLRVLHALGDAWPAWGAPRKKIEIDKNIALPSAYGRVGFIGDYGPTVTYGFSAGMKNSWFEIRYPDS